jgi:3-isopropylmalate dehydrogenase
MKIAVFAGDGIGPEVTREAVRVLDALAIAGLDMVEGDVGGAAYYKHGHPLPQATKDIAAGVDGILFGAVGDFSCDHLERALRPEQAILGLRSTFRCLPTCARPSCLRGWRIFRRCGPKWPARSTC